MIAKVEVHDNALAFDQDVLSDRSIDESTSPASSSTSFSSESTQVSGTELRKTPREIFVNMPDMFSSIMAVKPVVNPNYHKVKAEADAWITKVMKADEKWWVRNARVDLAYLASIWAPDCDEEALRMMVDWNHWVFLFDDQFDEGHLKEDLGAAQEEITQTCLIMEDTQPPIRVEDNPIRYIFQTTWDRLKLRAGKNQREHWKQMHQRFFDGLLTQVKTMSEGRVFARNVQEYMDMRRGTIGGYPAIALAEYGQGISLPPDIMSHPSLQECMCVSGDLVLLVNDVLSYKKDLALGVDHNLISLLLKQGHTIQEAVDKIGNMINNCYKRWYAALGNLDIWGEDLDRQVLAFVDTCRNVALGNLYWSFKTGRYLGAEGDDLHQTKRMLLPS